MHKKTITPTIDVFIAGAGPVGLTLAAALAEQDLSCRIVDKAPRRSETSKALVVWSRTLELLDNLGAAERFIETGLAARGVSIYGGSQRLVHLEIDDLASPFHYPLMIPQSETERLIAEHLHARDIFIEREVELVSFTEQSDSVACTLRHADGREEVVEANWLIGCDGAHSTVRHTLGMDFHGETEQNDWMLADIHVEGAIPRDEISVFWHEQGLLVFFPITSERMRMVADLGSMANTPRPTDPTLADVQAMMDQRGPGGLSAFDPVWLAGFRINERKVDEYRRGRVCLAGDAAHIHSPAGGQGMNTGMQDAFNLAWKLVLTHRGRARGDALLESYSRERSAIGDQVLRGATVLTRVATLRNPVAQFLRNHTASVLGSFGVVQDKIKNTLCELAINYRGGPIAAEAWRGTGGVSAGDRLPDARLVDSRTGDETTLFRAIHGTRHLLLLLPGSADTQSIAALEEIAQGIDRAFPGIVDPHLIVPADGAVCDIEPTPTMPFWLDSAGEVYEQHRARGPALILVRPDWYIGFRAQPADGDVLAAHLGTYLKRSDVGERPK